jgi:hypothetical protein
MSPAIANLSRKFVSVTCFIFSAVCLFAGCNAIRVGLGARIPLEKVTVASMKARLFKGPGVAPGHKASLVVELTQPDGKVLLTEGKGGGKIMWKDLKVDTSVVDVNQKGVISLRDDPRYSEGKTGHVTITAPSHPDLKAELDIPFRYDVAFNANFSARPGLDGDNGMDGASGTNGLPGSIDPDNPSASGDGGDGSNGSDGKDGERGGDAPNVLVRIAVQAGAHPLLQISVSAASAEKLFLIDPQGGSLTVKADGGRGGSGGRGGRGGSGGTGGIGSPNGRDGMSGLDGLNGSDGSSGNGGSIRVAYDPQAKPYLGILHLSNLFGPKPTFSEQQVAQIW